ncbi:hypothetical protein FRB99_000069 [Tulasnella sp. 403]|nr:hypothetical protein FRB99_000069 [Tulasnella sp. 403]
MRIQIPILSFLTIPLLLLPLPWHLRARNVATLTIITCLFFSNLIHGVNSIVWSGSVVVKAVVWCDITTKFTIGVQVALPAASLCITKHLECVASIRQTMQTADDKRRRQIFEFCLCCVFPCIIMALHYVVQGHRFDIAEDFGCMPTTFMSWPAVVIVYLPPMILATCSLIYAVIAFVWFIKRRAQFAEHLRSNNSGLTTGRYLRLMAMAVTEILVGTGLGTYVFALSMSDTLFRTWDNWAHVHSNFSRIAQYPRVLMPEYSWDRFLITWYIIPIGSVTFFIFLGSGQDAMSDYRRLIRYIRVHVLKQTVKPNNDSVLPTFSAPQRTARVVRLDDLDMISMDEKWDQDEKHDSESCSRQGSLPSTSVIHSTSDPSLPRPSSAPPTGRTNPEELDTRSMSLDLTRDMK